MKDWFGPNQPTAPKKAQQNTGLSSMHATQTRVDQNTHREVLSAHVADRHPVLLARLVQGDHVEVDIAVEHLLHPRGLANAHPVQFGVGFVDKPRSACERVVENVTWIKRWARGKTRTLVLA